MEAVWSEEVVGARLGAGRRRELVDLHARGLLPELEFEAIVFRAGPNRNCLKIRDEDLPAFAASFVGVPFLRDHAVESVAARAGIVASSVLDGRALRQTIRLTTQRDIRAFLEGQMDRFSVSWFYDEVRCTICGKEWGECGHKPGRRYAHEGRSGARVRCELEFVGPVGKEVSAVNAPAVEGTGVIAAGLDTEARRNGETAEKSEGGKGAATLDVSAWLRGRSVRGTAMMVHEKGVRMDNEQEWVDGLLARSGLSSRGMTAVRAALEGAEVTTPEGVQALVEAQRGAEPAPPAGFRSPVRGIEPSFRMRSPAEDVQDALAWLAGDTRIAMPAPHLRSWRDLYLAITGDVNFWGVFDPAQAQLQSANSTTLAGMAANALNKAVELHFENMVTYRWYEQVVAVLPHDGSTQPLTLLHLDGLAALPAVGEGQPYTESTAGDSKETIAFTKYGAYVGITLEMIRRSDIGRIQAIPRLLAQAAIRRRSAAVAAIFTGNPTLADDSTALFHANHGNLDTTAFGAAAWEAARARIFEQTVPGTGKPLALWPSFCLVPVELYDDALALFGYGSGDVGKPNAAGTAQEPNIYGATRPGDPRPIPIVVPEWIDATDWAYIVDPRLHPVLAMAYANAPAGGIHPLPELFEVRSETAGLMFSNDVLPVKARDWWACGVATHVGVGKNAVAG